MRTDESWDIVLFDGWCVLCHRSAKLIIKYDQHDKFRLATLQSENGRALLRKLSLPEAMTETLVLLEREKWYTSSTAVLRIARQLRVLWPFFYIFIWIPAPLRDMVYRWIARNRSHWFGKRESCAIPAPGEEMKFL